MKKHMPFAALLLCPALAAPLFARDENQIGIAKQGGHVSQIANASDEE